MKTVGPPFVVSPHLTSERPPGLKTVGPPFTPEGLNRSDGDLRERVAVAHTAGLKTCTRFGPSDTPLPRTGQGPLKTRSARYSGAFSTHLGGLKSKSKMGCIFSDLPSLYLIQST
ncbi:hypothetical protein BN873_690002 [Candidatus Competibacter denitrificans Run_A_D11]|uniref:Uncharacterized protein n=1 Tax=Candidatus Competibacter denitrificans Run_A_D11 TaxID=1400863 RepID=W6MC30_9GAMM|nr:hypothetical protein BN873_690002 [Candidatus Competibacter denitrificans Run_A_D11]